MKSYQILVVDDIVINRILLAEIIKEAGSECLQADNGKQAIEMLRRQPIDLILMDIEMPVMNGFETVKQIRNNFKEPLSKMPIIAITAHDPNSFFDEYQNAGFSELITKPYTVKKVTRIIDKFLN